MTRIVLPFLAGFLLTAVADSGESNAWVAPTVFGVVVAVMGWVLNQLITSVRSNLMQEIARVDAAARVCADGMAREMADHAKTKELLSDLRVEVKGLASQESVREMERDLGALVRSEVGTLRASIDALAERIHGGKSAQ